MLCVPGWRTPSLVLTPLRCYLRRLGYETHDWGLGRPTNAPLDDVERFVPLVKSLADRTGHPVTLIGWSLGGSIGREVARRLPEQVERLITIASPTLGGARWTVAADHIGAAASARIAEATQTGDESDPIRPPITAIFSRKDRIVSWLACIDRVNPFVNHLEAVSSHVGHRTADVPLTVRPIGRSGQRNECRRELFEAGDARSEVGEWGACEYVVRTCGQVRLNRGGDVSAWSHTRSALGSSQARFLRFPPSRPPPGGSAAHQRRSIPSARPCSRWAPTRLSARSSCRRPLIHSPA